VQTSARSTDRECFKLNDPLAVAIFGQRRVVGAQQASVVARALDPVGLTGAHPVMMTPSEHDRAVARISHVPHLVASALAASIRGADDAVLRLCGSGIRDVMRFAADEVPLSTDILRANAIEVSKVLAEIATELNTVAGSMRELSAWPSCRHTDSATDVFAAGGGGRPPARPSPGYRWE
jgi:prephenate dehydrogenase